MTSSSWPPTSGTLTQTAAIPPAELFGPDFAADPHAVYRELRAQFGSIASALLAPGVPASLVLSRRVARIVLQDPGTFTKDPRRWQAELSPTDGVKQVLPLMGHRNNVLFAGGAEHTRLRGAVSDSLGRTDLHLLGNRVRADARALIDRFIDGGQADLLADYAKPVALGAFNALFGCPLDLGARLSAAMQDMFDGVDPTNAEQRLVECLVELIQYKRTHPGQDVLTRMMAHPARLSVEELVNHLVVLVGAGNEPQKNLIANTLFLLLTDSGFGQGLIQGTTAIRDALARSMAVNPPMLHFGITFPVRDCFLEGTLLPAHQPVVIAYAAVNTDPELGEHVDWTASRAHLSWSAGPHSCLAQQVSLTIATTAIEVALQRLPHLDLAVPAEELLWRPGPFHRALETLPVRFTAPGDTRTTARHHR
jgi:cytochrome P450